MIGGKKRIGRGFAVGAYVPVPGWEVLAIAGIAGLAYAARFFVNVIFELIWAAIDAVEGGIDEYKKIKAEAAIKK